MKDTSKLNLGRETLIGLVSKFAMAAISFIGVVLFARWFGPVGYGIYRTAMAAALVVVQIPNGVGVAIKKRVSEVDVDPAPILSIGIAIHVATVLGAVILLFAFDDVATRYFTSFQIGFGAVAIVAALGAFTIMNQFFAGTGYPGKAITIDAVRSYLTFAVQVLFIWFGFQELGLILGFAVATLITAIGSAITAGVVPALPSRDAFDRVSSFARWSVPTSLLSNMYSSADILILRTVVGNANVGFYSTALQIAMPAVFLAGSIGSSLRVKASGLASLGDDVLADLKNAISYAGLFTIPAFFGALAIPEGIMRTVFGGEFSPAGPALIGLTLFQVFNSYGKPFEAVIDGIDRPQLTFKVNLGVIVVHLPLAVALGLEFGLVGVIAATVIAEASRLVMFQYLSWTLFGNVIFPRPIFAQIGSAAVMFVIVIFVKHNFLTITSWAWLLLVVGLAASIYFGLLTVISNHFRNMIDNTVGQFLPDALRRYLRNETGSE